MEYKLIIKKLNNTLTAEETILFIEWYNESQDHRNYFNNVKKNYTRSIQNINERKAWIQVENKIGLKTKKRIYWQQAAAILIILLISSTFILYKKTTEYNLQKNIVAKSTITPGTEIAILTLENGEEITLEKGKKYELHNTSSNGKQLIYNVQKSDSKKSVPYNYLTIPRGGQFFVQLSDGTKIWLNSESKLKYPIRFTTGEPREVELLYGEAYFDVSSSSIHNGNAFMVKTKKQQVKVLGTEFNIKAYHDEKNILTTLVEGKVSVGNGITKKNLMPEQQSTLDKETGTLSIKSIDTYNETSWKKGVFSFNSKSLKEIMLVLSRWYDLEVVFENKEIGNIKFNGVLSKNQNAEDILSIINKTNNNIITYEITNKKVIFK